MTRGLLCMASSLLLVFTSAAWSQDGENGSAPYLGQTPPALTPMAFAPGLVTTQGYEYGAAFSPDMQAFYFIRGRGEGSAQDFVVIRSTQAGWREEILSGRVGQPFISPDGQTLHLGGRYMTRTASGWSAIKTLEGAFEAYDIMRLTASERQTYVFDEIGSPDGDGLILSSRLVNGVRTEPVPFGPEINSGRFNAHPFIAPDESYMLWDGRRADGQGSSDIYVSFRQSDGGWGPAINLGDEVNTSAWEASASVTPDGRYLLFHRMISEGPEEGLPDVDIMWVDAEVVERHRPN